LKDYNSIRFHNSFSHSEHIHNLIIQHSSSLSLSQKCSYVYNRICLKRVLKKQQSKGSEVIATERRRGKNVTGAQALSMFCALILHAAHTVKGMTCSWRHVRWVGRGRKPSKSWQERRPCGTVNGALVWSLAFTRILCLDNLLMLNLTLNKIHFFFCHPPTMLQIVAFVFNKQLFLLHDNLIK
jgi:hypothetical protein